MRAVRHLTPADARTLPWKNGRGTTAELAIWPDGASFEQGDFEWRVSKARIAEDGPFSRFEEHDRVLVVLDGAGVDISHPGVAARARVRPLEPYRFRGDWPTEARLVGGPVSDFNVLFRRGDWEAIVEVVALGGRRTRETLAAGHAFVHVASGRATVRAVGEEDAFDLRAGDSLWIAGARADEEIDFAGRDPKCTFVLTRLAAPGRC